MIASSLLPSRFRGEQPASKAEPPSWLNTKISPFLQVVSKLTASHPIHTVVVVALLASSSYLGLLEERLFDATRTVRKADWASLAEGSRSLRAGPDSSWKWQTWDIDSETVDDADHLALLTFVFPESFSTDPPRTAESLKTIPIPQNLSITPLPSTSNSLTAYSQEISMALAVPYNQAPAFLAAAQELPSDLPSQETRRTGDGEENKMWIMKAARVNPRSSIARWAHNAWYDFIDLLKNAETLDIIIMVLGYMSMHLTFVSLFLSMRRLGSNFWLAASTLFSSAFAFMFGLIVTTKLGVPISMVLLSEGLPFLVITIGFEKNTTLTRAVLTHSIEHKAAQAKKGKDRKIENSNAIQSSIQVAIREKGFEIVKDYVIEIVVLVIGAASGVQGGLQQFCFLAAWILLFDCILLFTFYTAILCIKLEINRIKRHVEMRRALEDDGISHRVAENVAQNNDWPRADGKGQPGTSLFGRKIKSTSVPKFKVLMVGGFVLINAINLCTIPFRETDSLSSISSWAGGLGGLVANPPVDPFKVASNGLDSILAQATANHQEVAVTILTPIKYELEFPSVHYGKDVEKAPEDVEDMGYGVGGRMVGGVLKSLEDPVLSKWIMIALALSVAFNGYLFNAARWGIRDPNVPTRPIDVKELARAQKFNDADATPVTSGFERSSRTPTADVMPPTPAPTDDESENAAIQRNASTTSMLSEAPSRPYAELEKLLVEKRIAEMTDEEIIGLALKGKVPGHSLERTLKDTTRAVKIRRAIIARTKATTDITNSLERSKLPYQAYNWDLVLGACCENVIGYMPLPVGVAGPLVIDGQSFFIPMATTEGVLVASASRGCKAINAGGGAVTVLTGDGMTRGPCVTFETLERTGAAKLWLDSEVGQSVMKDAFNSTSRFARLEAMTSTIAGTNLYIRFKSRTGDAMGMNMISKGVEHALRVMATDHNFGDMQIVSLSGNYCIDKKPAAINWIEGRGKSVVAEAIIPADIVRSVLKTDVDSLVQLNIDKNLIGSAMAASVGGFNAHAANIVAAIFIATGQDPAQVVESANCITIMKNLRGSLQISVSMPSIEVGTLGGGTILEPQSAMLDMLGVRGAHPITPGRNAQQLARVVAATVLAGELSLCSALAAGHLVQAHMAHNRSAPPTRSSTPAPPPGLMMTSMTSQAAVDRAKR
ncbi:hypothetical protein M406DRAFT_91673 [Cryphonectria parasitica EP155]|uniref:3-hydroxy-3-methylglutaryl coenzyme A reductase n=1 Tax=Cryphonectria parasitica (strain ATCC 38755 / EP155) TaxID=660469 RepID=A0A9P4Y0R9_CRYP1|nr:uncharacterized protein M406DRAFT_91673 [Cryphonectria parasitica EP155]KAF3764275.1 hypothetical protein M406DRAFT_91673 [Cryphonectria parasitica EP155]